MKHKHLTYDDRLIIQQELENNYSSAQERFHHRPRNYPQPLPSQDQRQPHRTLRPRECLRNGKPVHR